MNFQFDQPQFLLLLLLAAPFVWLGLRSLVSLDPVRRWLAIGLRLAVLAVLVLMLAGMQAVREHSDLSVVVVEDRSESVRRFAQPPAQPGAAEDDAPPTIEHWVRQWLADATDSRKPDDKIGEVTFDSRATVRAMPAPGLVRDASLADKPRDGTDIASALRLGMAIFPQDSAKRLLLISDANDTRGPADLLAAAREAKALGIPVDVLPIDYQVDREVLVEGIYVPPEARVGQTVALRVVLRATAPSAGKLHVYHEGEPVDFNGEQEGHEAYVGRGDWSAEEAGRGSAAGRYVLVRMVELPMPHGGAQRFSAVFEPDAGSDAMAANNQAEAFTLVRGKGKVLLVDTLGPGPGDVLPNVLAGAGVELEVLRGEGIPTSLKALQKYDAILFQNVPAEHVPPPLQQLLVRYVSDLGGGFMMIGGPDSFGAGGWTHTAIDEVLPVECEIPSQTVLPSGALVLVLDRSGSMAELIPNSMVSKQEAANEAAVLALSTLFPQDMVGVIAFADTPEWIVPLQPNQRPDRVAKLVRSIHPGGGTNIYPGLEEAFRALEPIVPQEAAVKHVILLTDGQSPDARYHEVVGRMVRSGIGLSTIGVGGDVNAQLLDEIARMGNGSFHYIAHPRNLPQVFIKEARKIRKNLIKEVPFEPAVHNTGSPIASGLTQPPQLKGLVLTGEKGDPRVLMPMTGGEGEPLFAHWQVGLGRVAAFTSDATNRWATDWLTWPGYTDFWARAVRGISRPTDSREFDLLSTVQGDALHLRLDAAEVDIAGSTAGGPRRRSPSFGNFLRVEGSVLKPDGTIEHVKLQQTGPGVYEAQMPATEQGNYIVSLTVASPDGAEARSVFGGASRPAGAELRNFRSNRALLEEVAAISGGRVLDPFNPRDTPLFDRAAVVPSYSVRSLWQPLLVLLLALFLLDVACRRIAWDAAAIGQWLAGHFHYSPAEAHAKQEAAVATTAALRAKAARVEQRLGPGGASIPLPGAAAVDAGRKFEAAPGAVASPDFARAVGAAEVAAPSEPAAPAAARPRSPAGGPTTSRLLDIKRRARQKMEEDE